MMKLSTTTIDARDEATYRFETSAVAWEFVSACKSAGLAAGFPVLLTNEVRVLLATWR